MKSVSIAVHACVTFERDFKVLFMQMFALFGGFVAFFVSFSPMFGFFCVFVWFGVLFFFFEGNDTVNDFSKNAGVIAHTRKAFRPLVCVFNKLKKNLCVVKEKYQNVCFASS